MPLALQQLDTGVTIATLSGRLDIEGAREIDMPMNLLGGSRRAVVVDLTSVEFLASMGIRSIVFAARAIMSKRGACTLVSPPGDVRTVLTSSGIDEIIPIYDTMDEAILAVTPA